MENLWFFYCLQCDSKSCWFMLVQEFRVFRLFCSPLLKLVVCSRISCWFLSFSKQFITQLHKTLHNSTPIRWKKLQDHLKYYNNYACLNILTSLCPLMCLLITFVGFLVSFFLFLHLPEFFFFAEKSSTELCLM